MVAILPGAPSTFRQVGLSKVLHMQDLTDIYALSLSGVMCVYQSNPSQLCYNILIAILNVGDFGQ